MGIEFILYNTKWKLGQHELSIEEIDLYANI